MKKKALFIVNPAAGQAKPILSTINTKMAEANYAWDLYVTKKDQAIAEAYSSDDLQQYGVICAYGGDGTIHQVAQLIANSELPLLALQGGTGNTLSRELGIPQNLSQALTLLNAENLPTKQIDTAQANGNFFINVAVVGPLAEVSYETTRKDKDIFGVLAYVQTLFKKVPLDQEQTYSLELDGNEPFKVQAVGLIVLNSQFRGLGNIKITDKASLENNSLVVVKVPPMDHAVLADSILQLASTRSLENLTESWQCQQVRIRTASDQKVICDETMFQSSDIRIVVKPKSVSFVVSQHA